MLDEADSQAAHLHPVLPELCCSVVRDKAVFTAWFFTQVVLLPAESSAVMSILCDNLLHDHDDACPGLLPDGATLSLCLCDAFLLGIIMGRTHAVLRRLPPSAHEQPWCSVPLCT